MSESATPAPEPVWAWQVLDFDGRWGTITLDIKMGVGELGQSLVGSHVLTNRDESVVRGEMKMLAELHQRMEGKPIRLHRFIPDPDFEPEPL